MFLQIALVIAGVILVVKPEWTSEFSNTDIAQLCGWMSLMTAAILSGLSEVRK